MLVTKHHIALALVHRNELWLVAKRKASAHLGGYWEFPGGKVRPSETPMQAALRELVEECAVQATVEDTLASVVWRYDDRVVTLIPVICRWQAGAAQAQGNEECRWVNAVELAALDMPPANASIVRAALAWRAPAAPRRG